jgi:uncharacterized membrane protein YfcA
MTLATILGIFGIIAIIALAVLVRSIWGFGDGMLALPLLTLLIGFAQAAPLMALLSGVISIQLLREQPHLVDKPGVVRLIVGALFGVPLGLHLLVGMPVAWAHALLGLLLTGFASWSLAGRRSKQLRGWWMDLAFGMLAGACSAAFDIAGPPMLIYAAARGWSADELRVNLQAVFLPLSALTLGGHAIAGLWTKEVFMLAAMALPVVVLGLIVGPRLRARLGHAGEKIVYALILALGIVELARAGTDWLR